jgi:hypothetical protein
MDASIVASLQERDVFNDIARWNMILLSGVASVINNSKSLISQVTRHEEVQRTQDQTLSFLSSFGNPRSMSYISSTQSKEA